MEVIRHLHAPADLPTRKNPLPMKSRLTSPTLDLEILEKKESLPGSAPRVLQPLAWALYSLHFSRLLIHTRKMLVADLILVEWSGPLVLTLLSIRGLLTTCNNTSSDVT